MWTRIVIACIVIGLCSAQSLNGNFSLAPLLQTPQGTIQGLAGDSFYAYLGIPYAEAPVGDLRWAAPKPASAFSGVFNGTMLGKACPQPAWEGIEQVQSEDCLFVNVFTPKKQATGAGFPVMVYIHGGGYDFGSGMMPLYWGGNFANDNTGVILVTMNYRLGALGFLVVDGFGDQNFGFYDQQLALQWTFANIAAFGGDNSRITLAGQSAGGISVTTHLTAPSSFGLFSQAICQSGPPMVTFPTRDERLGYGSQFSQALGCSTVDVQCFRGKSVEEILTAQNTVKPVPFPIPLDTDPSSILLWMPVIDQQVILDSPQNLINQNKTAFVPMMWGSTRNETAGIIYDFLPSLPLIPAEYDAVLGILFGQENVTLVKSMYPARTSSQIREQLSQLSSDYIFTCSMRYSARIYANNGSPVYKYVFLHPPSTDPRCNGTVIHCANIQETCHGAELDYIFHTAPYAGASFTSAEDTLSWQTLSYWTAFVNGTISQTNWELYNPGQDNNLALDLPNPYILDNWRQEQCDFWDPWGYYSTGL